MLRRLAISSFAALAVLAGGLCVVPVSLAQTPVPVPPKANPLPADARYVESYGYVIKLSKIRINGREGGGGSIAGESATISFDYSVYFKGADGAADQGATNQMLIGIDPDGKTYLSLIKQGPGEVKGSFSGNVPFASEQSGGPTQISVFAFLTSAPNEAQARQLVAAGKGQSVLITRLSRPK